MRKPKNVVALIFIASMFIFIGCSGGNLAEHPVLKKPPNSSWDELPIFDRSTVSPTPTQNLRTKFDLRAIIKGEGSDNYIFNTYVFSGKVIYLKEYSVSWTDENGEKWGPFPRAVMEVAVNREYFGKSPVEGNVIKILSTSSLSWVLNNSVQIKESGEYVFVNCWVLDEVYDNYDVIYNPAAVNADLSSYADVIIGGAWNSMFPIKEDNVVLYHGYFEHDEEAKSKILPYDAINATDILTNPHSLETGDFVAMKMDDFEEAFLRLFENPDSLPTAKFD